MRVVRPACLGVQRLHSYQTKGNTMGPDPHKLYSCENTVGTQTKYEKGTTTISKTYEGICKGQAVTWCRNMLDGKAPKLTKPSYDRAAALQVRYEWSDSDKMFRLASMVAAGHYNGAGSILAGQVINQPGVYQIRYTGHALAAANQGGKFYFFDSEQGLYEYDNSSDLVNRFLNGYSSDKYQEMWRLAGS
jgi:hypothetical protein